MLRSTFATAAITLTLAAFIPSAGAAISFTPGHFYSTNYFSMDIIEYDSSGRVLGSLTLPAGLGDELRGLVFGPDNLLYVTAVRGSGFAVLALDSSGTAHETYPGNVYIRGSLSFGKLALDDASIYVAGQDNLIKFERGVPNSGEVIYTNNAVYDAKVLPSGNLFVASAYAIDEITNTGVLVRHLGDPSLSLQRYEVRAIEFDPSTNELFVAQLEDTVFAHELMRVDPTTGAVQDSTVVVDPGDLFLTSGGHLLVGSASDLPRLYAEDLHQIGPLAGGQRLFVTQHPPVGPLRRLGIAATKLIVVDKPAAAAGSAFFLARDAAVTKGSGTDAATIGVEFTVGYGRSGGGSPAGSFVMPVGDAGWLVNDTAEAKFQNRSAPAGTTQAKASVVRPGQLLQLKAAGPGDTRFAISGAGSPPGNVFTSYCITNGGDTTCLCSAFPRCTYKARKGGTGARLSCRGGVPDPTCASAP